MDGVGDMEIIIFFRFRTQEFISHAYVWGNKKKQNRFLVLRVVGWDVEGRGVNASEARSSNGQFNAGGLPQACHRGLILAVLTALSSGLCRRLHTGRVHE